MAFGARCKSCGFYEAAHSEKMDGETEAQTKIIENCPGYSPADPIEEVIEFINDYRGASPPNNFSGEPKLRIYKNLKKFKKEIQERIKKENSHLVGILEDHYL